MNRDHQDHPDLVEAERGFRFEKADRLGIDPNQLGLFEAVSDKIEDLEIEVRGNSNKVEEVSELIGRALVELKEVLRLVTFCLAILIAIAIYTVWTR